MHRTMRFNETTNNFENNQILILCFELFEFCPEMLNQGVEASF